MVFTKHKDVATSFCLLPWINFKFIRDADFYFHYYFTYTHKNKKKTTQFSESQNIENTCGYKKLIKIMKFVDGRGTSYCIGNFFYPYGDVTSPIYSPQMWFSKFFLYPALVDGFV